MFKPGSVNGRCGELQIQTRESIKLNVLTGNDKRRHCTHQNMQSNKMNVVQHIAKAFYRKYSDVNSWVNIIKLHTLSQ